jgi:hypothetical protein
MMSLIIGVIAAIGLATILTVPTVYWMNCCYRRNYSFIYTVTPIVIMIWALFAITITK